MKKTMSVLLAFVLLLLPLSSFAEEFSFRNGVKFGMTRDEIVFTEGMEPAEENGGMIFYTNQKAAGRACSILYVLENGKLHSIMVSFDGVHSNNNLYIDDHEDVRKSLTAKYGEPSRKGYFNWKNDLFKGNADDYGLAISVGHLSIVDLWLLDNVQISNVLNGDNYRIDHGILYADPNYTHQQNTDGI